MSLRLAPKLAYRTCNSQKASTAVLLSFVDKSIGYKEKQEIYKETIELSPEEGCKTIPINEKTQINWYLYTSKEAEKKDEISSWGINYVGRTSLLSSRIKAEKIVEYNSNKKVSVRDRKHNHFDPKTSAF
ncbi:MAG: hypothetical protein F6K24_43080 [Okeania sp. SIO2D1]|nr:hypothetical protein [Okeania sp. SIO2D1]